MKDIIKTFLEDKKIVFFTYNYNYLYKKYEAVYKYNFVHIPSRMILAEILQ